MAMIMRNLSAALVAVMVVAGGPAWAQMPQTDVELVRQMGDVSAQDKIEALQVFYDLHVSELDVQLKHEVNTGAFFGVQRAQGGEGDLAAAEARARETRADWDNARAENVMLRQELNMISGIDFPGKFAMTPEAPMDKPAAPAGAPQALLAERDAAWQRVEQTRDALGEERMKLLEAQQQYDETRDVAIGDAMRDMTRAEVAAARAAADFRLIEAKIAAATDRPIAEALENL